MSRKQDINAMDSALQGGDAGFVNSDAQRRSNADWTKQQSLRGSSPRNRKNRLNVAAGSAIQSGLGAATGAGLAAVASGSKRAMTIGALGGAATGLATGYQAGKRVNAKQTQLGSVLRSKQRGDIKLSRNGVNPLTGINKSAFGVVHTDISKGAPSYLRHAVTTFPNGRIKPNRFKDKFNYDPMVHSDNVYLWNRGLALQDGRTGSASLVGIKSRIKYRNKSREAFELSKPAPKTRPLRNI